MDCALALVAQGRATIAVCRSLALARSHICNLRSRPEAWIDGRTGRTPVNARVNQDILVVRILRKHFKNALPDAPPAPARVAQMHDVKVTKAPGQVSPGDAYAVAVQHCLDKQPVVSRRHAHIA